MSGAAGVDAENGIGGLSVASRGGDGREISVRGQLEPLSTCRGAVGTLRKQDPVHSNGKKDARLRQPVFERGPRYLGGNISTDKRVIGAESDPD